MASERGGAQTGVLVTTGLKDCASDCGAKPNGSGKANERGESPVGVVKQRGRILSTTIHANIVGSRGVHTPRLNTRDDR